MLNMLLLTVWLFDFEIEIVGFCILGFHVIFLPFADDIRTVDAHVGPTASDEQVDKMKEIVHKLRFKYRCVVFYKLYKFFKHGVLADLHCKSYVFTGVIHLKTQCYNNTTGTWRLWLWICLHLSPLKT